MNMRSDFAVEGHDGGATSRARRRLFLRMPLRMLSIGRIFRGGRVDDVGRLPRYVVVFLAVAVAVWTPVTAYIRLTPPAFTSGMALILPGAGTNASVNLSEIGQASSFASSPYSSSAVSPTVTYKNLVTSGRVRERAAAALGLTLAELREPRVKLVDQTSLILVETKGASPEAARERAEALLAAFLTELERLRADEVARREQSYRSAIADYQASVARTRAAITALQSRTGLVSTAQYAALVVDADALDARVRDLAASLALKENALVALTASLGITPAEAAVTLRLHADPEFQSLAEAMALHAAEVAVARATYGPKHPNRVAAEQAYTGARGRALARAGAVTGMEPDVIAARVDLAPTGERAGLLAKLVTLTAERDGIAAEHETLSARLTVARERVMALVGPAAELDDLGRDYQVAEAVLTSALARNDTTKADVYASYPLVQVLEPPSLPDRPSSPNVKVALAGGVAATFLAIIALLMGWLRRPLIDRLLRKDAEAA